MKNFLLPFIILAPLFTACGGENDIQIHEAWIRPTAQGENAAVYFVLHNHTNDADELIGASTVISDSVEIHQNKMVNDVMHMSMVSSIPLGPGEEVMFSPGGYHIMLVDINQKIKKGDHIGLILHFKNHEDIVADVLAGDGPANLEDHDHEE